MHFLYDITKSATRIILILFSIVLSIAVLYTVLLNPKDHDLVLSLHSLFANVIISVISFFFGQKGLPNAGTSEQPSNTLSTSRTSTQTFSVDPIDPVQVQEESKTE